MSNSFSVIVRVDASPEIGTGHFMRCFTLAKKLSEMNASIHFISRHMPKYFVSILKEANFQFSFLYSELGSNINELPHSAWLGVSQEQDALQTLSFLHELVDLIIVDHYALDAKWENYVRYRTKKIMVIDDLADRSHSCDFLLDQNFFFDAQKRYEDLVPSYCMKFFGPEFALLRDEFIFFREKAIVRDGNVKKILVLMGGIDKFNITFKVIQAINNLNYPIDVDVVVGKQHPALQVINDLCQNKSYRFFIQPNNLAQLMTESDISIGSSGSTSWERCAVGLPTICFTQASNQIPIADNLERFGIIVNGGSGVTASVDEISKTIKNVIDNPKLVKLLSKRSMNLVDALGVLKVAKSVYKLVHNENFYINL
jgi:UDP-2,4-diacetamido-2,4,6-trideoxy-beta-L-altropyranose hydrolase